MIMILPLSKAGLMGFLSLIIIVAIAWWHPWIQSPSLYVALGDVFASGTIYEGKTQLSYVDYLGQKLIQTSVVQSYNKAFTQSTMTSHQLLRMVSEDSWAIQGKGVVQLSTMLKASKIITISIGLNDWIDHMEWDRVLNEIAFDEEVVSRKLDIMQGNVFEILTEVQKLAPQAQIYLTGYYFMFPKLADQQKPLMTLLFQDFEKHLENAAIDAETNFMPIHLSIKTTYYLDPLDIYLSESGQAAVAQQMMALLN